METNWWKEQIRDQMRGSILVFLFIFAINCSLGVNAQGTRGVVINNKKFDDSSGVELITIHQFLTPSFPKVNIVFECVN